MKPNRRFRYPASFSVTTQLLQHPFRVWLSAGVVLLILGTWALNYSATYLPRRALQAKVFRGTVFEGNPRLTVTDSDLNPNRLALLAGVAANEPFGIEWEGHLVVEKPGRYQLRVGVEDGVAIWIDNESALDSVAAEGRRDLSVAAELEQGLRHLRIRYVLLGGQPFFRLRWSRPEDRADFQPVFAVPPSDPPLVFRRVSKAMRFPKQVATAWSIWILVGLALGLYAAILALARRAFPRPALSYAALPLVAAASWLFLVGLTVGSAPLRSWVPDEIKPADVLQASNAWFSDGWSHKYPPLQFYLLSLVTVPFSIAEAWQWLSYDGEVLRLLHVLGRSLTVAMALLTVVLIWIIGDEVLGKPRIATIAGFLALVPVLAFYGKTTNVDVPSMLWVLLALLSFIRAAKYRTLFDHAALGLSVALAVATKDQTYGFFPGVACVLLWQSWREQSEERSTPRRLLRTLFDRRIWAGAIVCGMTYTIATGVLWNYSGVNSHFNLIVGTSQPYRMYPRSWAGFGQLMLRTLTLLPLTLGVVVTALTVAGVARTVVVSDRFRFLRLLLIPLLSYVLTFVAVVGYVYDRFLLVVVVVAALFAAVGLDWLTGLVRNSRLRMILTAAVVALTLTPAIVMNWQIATDSRVRVEQWMQTTLRDDPVVLGVGTQEFLPHLRPFAHYLVVPSSAADLLHWNADVIVLNEQWLDRPGLPGHLVVTKALRDAGFRERFAVRPGSRSVIDFLFRSGTMIDPFYSNLAKIDPPLSVWTRDGQDVAAY